MGAFFFLLVAISLSVARGEISARWLFVGHALACPASASSPLARTVCDTLQRPGCRPAGQAKAYPTGDRLTSLSRERTLTYRWTMGRTEIPPGTLYMLILKSLARLGPMHGYGIAQHIQQQSEDVLQVEEGSLYPALQRMLIKGWVVAEWGQSENNRRAVLPHDRGREEATDRRNQRVRTRDGGHWKGYPTSLKRNHIWKAWLNSGAGCCSCFDGGNSTTISKRRCGFTWK